MKILLILVLITSGMKSRSLIDLCNLLEIKMEMREQQKLKHIKFEDFEDIATSEDDTKDTVEEIIETDKTGKSLTGTPESYHTDSL